MRGEGGEGPTRHAAVAFCTSARLLIHLHFEWGKQPLERKPESHFTASFHCRRGNGARSSQAQQHGAAEDAKGYDRAKVTPHCDRAGTTPVLLVLVTVVVVVVVGSGSGKNRRSLGHSLQTWDF